MVKFTIALLCICAIFSSVESRKKILKNSESTVFSLNNAKAKEGDLTNIPTITEEDIIQPPNEYQSCSDLHKNEEIKEATSMEDFLKDPERFNIVETMKGTESKKEETLPEGYYCLAGEIIVNPTDEKGNSIPGKPRCCLKDITPSEKPKLSEDQIIHGHEESNVIEGGMKRVKKTRNRIIKRQRSRRHSH